MMHRSGNLQPAVVAIYCLLGLSVCVPVAAQLGNVDEFLHPDEAFRMRVEPTASGYQAVWDIAREYYLYRDKIGVLVAGTRIELELPEGRVINDEFFGETAVFRNQVAAGFTPPRSANTIQVTYQGCADAGLCYAPVTKSIALASLAPRATAAQGTVSPPGAPGAGLDLGMQDKVLSMLHSDSVITVLLSFLVFGLLLSVTPCVLPIIPVLLSTLTRGGPKTPLRATALSGVFVLAMAAVYSLLGVATGLLGESVQAWFQKPWLIGLFATVFVLLALSMFGLFSIQMPSSVQSRLSTATMPRQQGGSIAGAAMMGAGTAVIVGPCVTPALIGALLFIAQTRDAVLGGTALFVLALGMGIPLIVAGASLGKLLPKPGGVRNAASVVIGFLLLGVAVWLLDRIAPPTMTMFLVGAWLVLAGEYMRRAFAAREGVGASERPVSGVVRGVGVVLLLYGAVLIVGAATGNDSLLKPLARMGGAVTAGAVPGNKDTLPFKAVDDLKGVREAIRPAANDARMTMLYFHADWCVSCKELKAFTFSDERVHRALEGMQLLDVDVTENAPADKALLKEFTLFGPPGVLFFTSQGEEVGPARIVGFVPADDFVAHVQSVRNLEHRRL